MSEPIEYIANSARFFILGDDLWASIATNTGQHVKIKFGVAQAESMDQIAGGYVIDHYRKAACAAREALKFTA